MTMTTIPSISQKRWRAFQRKAVCDHDHHPFPCQKEEDWSRLDLRPLCQEEELLDLLPELQGLGRLGEGQPNGLAQLRGDRQRRLVLSLQPGLPPPPFLSRTQPSSKKLYSSSWKGKGWWSWPYRVFLLMGKGRDGGHCHTLCSSGKGKNWSSS